MADQDPPKPEREAEVTAPSHDARRGPVLRHVVARPISHDAGDDTPVPDYGTHFPNEPPEPEDSDSIIDFAPKVKSQATKEERDIFHYLTYPDDLYTTEGVYWADLPLGKRVTFINKINSAETSKEWGLFWRAFKKDPLSPVRWYLRNGILAGVGIGLEGYVMFAIGNLAPLFAATWPECWGPNPTVCDKQWVYAVTYLSVVGMMVGQIVVGIIGDWIGRRWGLIQDSVMMFIALIMLASSWGTTLEGWVICYAWSLWLYSFAVGGEHPLTATTAMENAVGTGKVSAREDRLHRGRKVVMAFSIQGWGQLANQVLLICLLLVFHAGNGDPPYSYSAVHYTFRLSFIFPALGCLWLTYYRIFKMTHASAQLNDAKRKRNVTGYDSQSFRLLTRHFKGRLLATAGSWFCSDIFFYGTKLFQGQFINVIEHNPSSVMVTWVWNLCGIMVAIVGYHFAVFLVDHKLYGRKMMQQVGFLACFICFVIPAFNYQYFSTTGIHAFQAMYFISCFFIQFGPNCVIFLVGAEVYPTSVRTTAHGFSGACGKMGALTAAVLYNYIDTQQKFYFVPWLGLVGTILTFVFMPDTTGLDLKEQDRRWKYITEGREHEYHGVAVHPQHLSLWERMMGLGKYYDPELDLKQKIEDMRMEWELREKAIMAKESGNGDSEILDNEDFNDDVRNYFGRTSGNAALRKRVGAGVRTHIRAISNSSESEDELRQARPR